MQRQRLLGRLTANCAEQLRVATLSRPPPSNAGVSDTLPASRPRNNSDGSLTYGWQSSEM